MLILQALLLWLMVSTLMVGGAMVFHHYFPEESPWFGFIVPSFALVLLLNFIEHGVALPILVWLLPVFLAGTVWLAVAKGWFKEPLILPSVVFLLAFGFTFGVRCLQPDIDYTSDGLSDLNMINNFSQGETVPPPDTWLPPYRYEWYYDLQHYAASVVERILHVKAGVGYNVAEGLLSALICVVGAGAAYRISGGKIWITLAVPFLIVSVPTGSSAYIMLTMKDPSVWFASDLSGGMALPHPNDNSLWKVLLWDPRPEISSLQTPEILRLQVPGFWTWRSEYHANASGHLFTLLAVLIIVELAFARRTLWPWVMAGLTPLLAVAASAWALPITALLCWLAVPFALLCGRRPVSSGNLVLAFGIAVTLLWPAFYNATSSPQFPAVMWTKPEWRVPFLEFLVQWWPILALWACAFCCFRSLSFGLRWVLIVVPLMLIGIELVTVESRYNTVEKMWGYTWGAGLIAFFPFVATRTGIAFRLVTITLLISALLSLVGFMRDVLGRAIVWDPAPVHLWDSAFHLEGDQYLMSDEQKKRIVIVLTQLKKATMLSGKDVWCYNESPAPAVFTGNRSYIAWDWYEQNTSNWSEAPRRAKLNNDFYSAAMTNRLQFLKDNKITGVLVWPDDEISDDALGALRKDLEPAYEYVDCRGTGIKNAGVFLARPLPGN